MDELDDYNSEEDEDYVYEAGSDGPDDGNDEDGFGGPAIGGMAGKKRKKGGLNVLARPGKEWKANKKAKKGGVGAAVISDEEEEELPPPARPVPPPAAATQEPTRPVDAIAETDTDMPEAAESVSTAVEPSASSSTSASSHAAAASASSAHSLSAILAAHSSGSSTVASSPPAPALSPLGLASPTAAVSNSSSRPSSTIPPTTPTTPGSGGGLSLAQIMAGFQKPKSVLPTTVPAPTAQQYPWDKKPTTPGATAILPTQTPAQASASAALASFLAKTAPKAPAKPVTAATLSDDKITVKEITSYAGETMEITKTIIKGSVEDKLRQKNSKDNLASLVESLSAKKSMSTLAKSKVDWQISKDEEGDSAELEKATKNGYVDKLAFLQKTDLRQFELEKEARNQARRLAEKKAREAGTPGAHAAPSYEHQEEDEPEEAVGEEKEGIV